MLGLIIIIISIYLDGFLSLFLPYIPHDLSFFTPMFTLVSLILIYPLYKKKEKKYYIISFIIGFIYDLLYTNLLFYNAVIFLLFGFIIKKVYDNFDITNFIISLYIIVLITSYEIINGLLICLLVPVTPIDVLYKITHSLLLNIIYGEVIFLIIRLLPYKYKRIDIN